MLRTQVRLPNISAGPQNGKGDVRIEEETIQSLSQKMELMSNKMELMGKHMDQLSRALIAEESARVATEDKLRALVQTSINIKEPNGRAPGHKHHEARFVGELLELKEYVDTKVKEIDSRIGGENNDLREGGNLASILREIESGRATNAQIIALITTLQTHVADEHVHRINGQQELREVLSAEITARRKAQNKVSGTLDSLLKQQMDDLAKLRSENSQLQENLGLRISALETNVSTAVSSLFQEVRDVREYVRTVVGQTKEDLTVIKRQVAHGGGNSANSVGAVDDLQLAIVEKMEDLHEQNCLRIDQITNQSRNAWAGLNDRVAALELSSRTITMSLDAEINSRFKGDMDTQVQLERTMGALQSRTQATVEAIKAEVKNIQTAVRLATDKLERTEVYINTIVENNTGFAVTDKKAITTTPLRVPISPALRVSSHAKVVPSAPAPKLETYSQETAATKLQAIQRGRLAKKQVQQQRVIASIPVDEEAQRAAAKMQAMQRAKAAKRRVEAMRAGNVSAEAQVAALTEALQEAENLADALGSD
jgi:hypothetical protein